MLEVQSVAVVKPLHCLFVFRYMFLECPAHLLIRPELIIHLNLPIIQIFYSQICSLLFNNMSLLLKKKKKQKKKRTSDNMKDKKSENSMR